MYGSQFDGNAAFSGGGFMASQTTQTPDTSFSPAKVTSFSLRLVLGKILEKMKSGMNPWSIAIHFSEISFSFQLFSPLKRYRFWGFGLYLLYVGFINCLVAEKITQLITIAI